MSDFTVEIPEVEQKVSRPIGLPMAQIIPELQFPRKLENCSVRLWYGSEFRGTYSTDEYQMWLLSDNVIKLDDGRHL